MHYNTVALEPDAYRTRQVQGQRNPRGYCPAMDRVQQQNAAFNRRIARRRRQNQMAQRSRAINRA